MVFLLVMVVGTSLEVVVVRVLLAGLYFELSEVKEATKLFFFITFLGRISSLAI